jgi:hypothetical protein|tara:strand:- start:103 stop:300 length:198 start_codon:yes stop_codon:yes gene_type:complete
MFVVSTPFAVIQTNVLTDLLQITTLTMEIQQFMTVKFSSKEIFDKRTNQLLVEASFTGKHWDFCS